MPLLVKMYAALGAVLAVGGASAGGAVAEQSSSPAPCARTTIVKRTLPSGPAQYESGVLALKNGVSLRLQGSAADMYRARGMHVGDPVAACYGPLTRYADAPPSRATTVLDLSNGNYYGTPLGDWKHLP